MSLKGSICLAVCLFLVTGCQGFILGGKGATRSYAPPDPTARVKLEADRLEHDGTFLSGRFLIGVEKGKIRLDKRLVENVSVTVESVSTCDTKESVPFIEADYLTKPRTDEYLLTLGEGYWYGADLRFLLLAEEVTGELGPPCIDVEFSLTSFDRHMLTRKSFRAWRKGERPPTEPATGSPAQPAPAQAPSSPAP